MDSFPGYDGHWLLFNFLFLVFELEIKKRVSSVREDNSLILLRLVCLNSHAIK
jgi:hypothetical protein